jgi:DNA-binding response OmpR family regulator
MPCILIVDDEPLIGELLEAAFRRQGFQVILAPGGTQAVALYQAHQQSIDLVLLDVHMPWLDGPQTLHRLREINPKVRVCFVTGNTERYSPEELLQLGAVRVFLKPFQVAQVVEAVSQILGP